MNAEKILAQHPDPTKQGTKIDKAKYDVIQDALLAVVDAESGKVAFKGLDEKIGVRVGEFDGSIG